MSKSYQKEYRENMSDEQKHRKNIEKTCQMNRNKDIEINKKNIEII